MSDARLRFAIAYEAARLLYSRTESEYYTAKRKAAKRICRGNYKPSDLPSNAEIREMVQSFARMYEGDKRKDNLREMRIEALKMMRLLRRFKPRLIGSVFTGHVRAGSDIDLHLFCDSVELIEGILREEGIRYDLERKRVVKHQESRIFTHLHVQDRFPFELTVYAENQAHYVFKSSITGKAIERASIRELEEFLTKEYPDLDLESLSKIQRVNDEDLEDEDTDALYLFLPSLLEPLEKVKQSPKYHPEGDVLYHLLQVFELARDAKPYDEEFLLAALLHDVGKGMDPQNHIEAGLEALDGLITDRTRFFIENHMLAHQYRDGTLGFRQKTRLESSDDLEDLLLLSKLDQQGREPAMQVCTLREAINYLERLSAENEGS